MIPFSIECDSCPAVFQGWRNEACATVVANAEALGWLVGSEPWPHYVAGDDKCPKCLAEAAGREAPLREMTVTYHAEFTASIEVPWDWRWDEQVSSLVEPGLTDLPYDHGDLLPSTVKVRPTLG